MPFLTKTYFALVVAGVAAVLGCDCAKAEWTLSSGWRASPFWDDLTAQRGRDKFLPTDRYIKDTSIYEDWTTRMSLFGLESDFVPEFRSFDAGIDKLVVPAEPNQSIRWKHQD